ncbi:hypothetical protein SAMN05421788_10813 [Filimonas lacunae]|uniref:Uncharacterized protein n=1 Tax=Filimonas lacunae TaxID=477680 RepID=A0A173MEE0_9BACT|nr:hypothetical protein [Filimonas lacunae]BAV05849.1 hypothetical protein FLA_1861 [Filimonas lacunae]SIT28378.1 hypothetical protein SAMN05421788_10813 [Filimonas lacunae]
MKQHYPLAQVGRIIIYPDKQLRHAGLISLALAGACSIMAFHFTPVWLYAALLLMIAAVVLIATSGWCVVFDTNTAAIHYSWLRVFNWLLVKFENIDNIGPAPGKIYGVCYKVTCKSGKRIRISTLYSTQGRGQLKYEASVLPVLENMIQSTFVEKEHYSCLSL